MTKQYVSLILGLTLTACNSPSAPAPATKATTNTVVSAQPTATPTASPTVSPSPSPSPSPSVTATPVISKVSLYGQHSCAMATDGTAYCWGDNTNGMLGVGDSVDRHLPSQVLGVSSGFLQNVTDIAAGGNSNCAVSAGNVYCFGLYDGVAFYNTPTLIPGMPSTMTNVSVGSSHACALAANGDVYCWGSNGSGQIGDGTYNFSAPPVITPEKVLTGASQILVGDQTSCAIKSSVLYCWGYPMTAVGFNAACPSTIQGSTRVAVQSPCSNITMVQIKNVQTATAHTCTTTSSILKCQGSNSNGQIGDGTTTDAPSPEVINL